MSYQTPIQILQNYFPKNKCFTTLPPKVFGSTVFVHVHDHKRSKLDPRAIKCIFLGFSPTQKGFKCFDPCSGKLYISMDVTFFENKPFFEKTSLQGENSNEDQFWEVSEVNVLPKNIDESNEKSADNIIPSYNDIETNSNEEQPVDFRVCSRSDELEPPALPSSPPSIGRGTDSSLLNTPHLNTEPLEEIESCENEESAESSQPQRIVH